MTIRRRDFLKMSGAAALSGALIPVSASSGILGILAKVIPMTYSIDLARNIFYWGKPEYSAAVLHDPLCDLAVTIASRFPEGVVPYYRVLPRLLERSGIDGLAHWVEEGLAIAADGREAGIAFFALDSRTSRAVLAASSTAVAFTEVRGLVKRYLHMLTGRDLEVDARADVGYRPPFLLLVEEGEPQGRHQLAELIELGRLQ